MDLLGRVREREVLDRLLANVRRGQSRALVIRGEPGIGKTALLRYAGRRASGFRVAKITGVEAEIELPFAGVHQLCAPMFDRLDALPEPQRDALGIALGLKAGNTPDRFLVALAVLSLLSAVAEAQQLLCIVDDVHWLDDESDQVLGFVGRRLLAESVAIVFAGRDNSARREFEDLPEMRLEGLNEEDARSLLSRAVPGRLDERVRDQIVAESRGNPLALLELPRGRSAAELAGGFQLAGARDLGDHLEAHYLRQIAGLPEATRRLMLLAAADPIGDATLVWRAAHRLGIDASALLPAQEADLLEIAARVRFRHPLLRSAVYRAGSLDDRQRVHHALADETDPQEDPDRRAWHRALAAKGLDDDLADELERSAGRAQTRGGIAAAAAFLERAAASTADPARRARRALAAARAKHEAGAPEAALALLASAETGPLDHVEHAQVDVLRAEIDFTSKRGGGAPTLLLAAAKRLEVLEVTLARETYLEALMAAQFAGRLAPGAVLRVAEAARGVPASPSPRAPDLLLDGFVVMITEGHRAGEPHLRRALDAFRDGDVAANGGFRWLSLAIQAAQEVWDHDTWCELAVLQLQLVRDVGALTMLPLALMSICCAQIYAGELAAAASLIDDQKSATEATGSQLAPYGALILTAWQGREASLSALIDATLEEVIPRGEGIGVSACQWVAAILQNGLGRYEDALATAQQVINPPRKMDWPINATLPELIEAAARSGHP